MNHKLIDVLRQIGTHDAALGVQDSTGAPLQIAVGEIDRNAGKLLHHIRVSFGELASDPDWVMALLNAAQFWLTFGCAMIDTPPVPEGGDPGPDVYKAVAAPGEVDPEEEKKLFKELAELLERPAPQVGHDIPPIPPKDWAA